VPIPLIIQFNKQKKMKSIKKIVFGLMILSIFSILSAGCNISRTKKGAMIGAGGGTVIGGVIGRAAGNTALGALIGATVGGATGAIIGHKMDKQAEEIERKVPGVKVYRVGEGIIVEFGEKILFGYDKSNLTPSSKTSLNNLATVLNKYPDTNMEVQGHTDNTGTNKYNMSLSKRRAKSVSKYIANLGISSRRTSTRGYGETAPNYSNESEASRAQNRRVEFLITANAKMLAEAKKG
jgi:outer membrane protein OmpA-like peptidoglycan-associated protein